MLMLTLKRKHENEKNNSDRNHTFETKPTKDHVAESLQGHVIAYISVWMSVFIVLTSTMELQKNKTDIFDGYSSPQKPLVFELIINALITTSCCITFTNSLSCIHSIYDFYLYEEVKLKSN